MNGLLLPDRQVFLVDTHVNYDPTPEELAEITTMAAEEMMRFGLKPKAALLSHSNFGTSNEPSALKMRKTLDLLRVQAPWLEVDGEMHGDVALDSKQRAVVMPHSALAGDANLLVFPNIDAAKPRNTQDGGRRQHRDRPGAARSGQTCAHSHGERHRAAHREHVGAHGGRRQRRTLSFSKHFFESGRQLMASLSSPRCCSNFGQSLAIFASVVHTRGLGFAG